MAKGKKEGHKLVEELERSNRFFLALAFIMGFISLYTIQPFINLILASAFLAYLFQPLERLFAARISSRSASALLVSTVISLVAIIGFMYAIVIIQEAVGSVGDLIERSMPRIAEIEVLYKSVLSRYGIDLQEEVTTMVRGMVETVKSGVVSLIIGLPTLLLTYILLIFLTYYFLIEGNSLVTSIVELFPCKRRNALEKFISDTDKLARGIIFGHFAVSIFLGAVSYPGYVLIGKGDSVAYAFITTIVALVPIVGASAVPAALSIYNFMRFDLITGMGMLVLSVGLFILSQVAYAYVSRRTTQVHPGLVILGMISGPFVFGAVGFFVGPIVLGTFFNALSAYRENLELVTELDEEGHLQTPAHLLKYFHTRKER